MSAVKEERRLTNYASLSNKKGQIVLFVITKLLEFDVVTLDDCPHCNPDVSDCAIACCDPAAESGAAWVGEVATISHVLEREGRVGSRSDGVVS